MSAKKPAGKADAREAARIQAAQMRVEQERRDKRSRTIAVSFLIVAVVALVVVAALILKQGGDKPLADTAAPANVTSNGGISFGKDRVAGTTNGDDAVELGVYVDFSCSYCVDFEIGNADAINEMLSAGDITLVLYPVSLLNSPFSDDGARATAHLADKAPEHALDFFNAVFATNPKVNGPLTQGQLRTLAIEQGVDEATAKSMFDGAWDKWVAAASAAAAGNPKLANAEGKFGTPTITINGERMAAEFNWTVDGQLAAAVAAAKK